MVLSFALSVPRTKRLCRCQTPDIVVVVVVLDLGVVAVAIVYLSTLASIAALYLKHTIALYLIPPPIFIYPPITAPYSFNLDLNLDSSLILTATEAWIIHYLPPSSGSPMALPSCLGGK